MHLKIWVPFINSYPKEVILDLRRPQHTVHLKRILFVNSLTANFQVNPVSKLYKIYCQKSVCKFYIEMYVIL